MAPFGTSQILKLKYQKKWVLEYFTNKRMDPLKSKGRHAISIFIWVQTDISVEAGDPIIDGSMGYGRGV